MIMVYFKRFFSRRAIIMSPFHFLDFIPANISKNLVLKVQIYVKKYSIENVGLASYLSIF